MERNCEEHIKTERQGDTTVFWRCLNDHTTTKEVNGRTIRVCKEHKS